MTEERVVPGKTSVANVCKHIARYNLAQFYTQGKKVLDAACGSGYGSFMLSHGATEVFGVDIDSDAIEHARQNYSKDNILYKTSNLEDMDYTDKFDAIVSFETLEHMKEPDKVIHTLSTMLKTGGLFIYSLPLYEKPGQNEYHHSTYTLETARSLVGGYNVEEFIQAGINFFSPLEDKRTPFTYYFSVRRM